MTQHSRQLLGRLLDHRALRHGKRRAGVDPAGAAAIGLGGARAVPGATARSDGRRTAPLSIAHDPEKSGTLIVAMDACNSLIGRGAVV